MRSLARRSPRSIFFASSTSSAAVRRSCLPISFMNSVSESATPTASGSRSQLELVLGTGIGVGRPRARRRPRPPARLRAPRARRAAVASSSSSRSSSAAFASSRRSSRTPSSSTSSMKAATTLSSKMVLIFSSLCSGRRRSRASALEALDPATTHGFALDARVRRMTLRADVEHELARADRTVNALPQVVQRTFVGTRSGCFPATDSPSTRPSASRKADRRRNRRHGQLLAHAMSRTREKRTAFPLFL